MVMALAAPPSQSSDPVEYDSEIIDSWLKRWPELESRAEHMRSPSAYDVARPAPTRGRFASGTAVEIMADIERAHAQLHRGGLNWRVIELRKNGTGSLGAIARVIGIRKDDVCGAHKAALAIMVEYLNGVHPQPVVGAVGYGVHRL